MQKVESRVVVVQCQQVQRAVADDVHHFAEAAVQTREEVLHRSEGRFIRVFVAAEENPQVEEQFPAEELHYLLCGLVTGENEGRLQLFAQAFPPHGVRPEGGDLV